MGFGPYNTPSGTLHFCTPEDGLLTCSGNVFRTNDGANQWSRVESPLDGRQVWSILLAEPPVANTPGSDIVVVGTCPAGLFLSEDGGKSWSIENPAEKGVLLGTAGMRHGTVPPGYAFLAEYEAPGPLRAWSVVFTAREDRSIPGTCLASRMISRGTTASRALGTIAKGLPE